MLDHQYSESSLSFDELKNGDLAKVEALRHIQDEADIDIHLAIITKTESGFPDGFNYHNASMEITNTDIHLGQFTRIEDDCAIVLGDISVDEDEIVPDGALDDLDPDHEKIEEATGNEGASMERWYHIAAVVIWPKENAIRIYSETEAGFRYGITLLNAQVEKCKGLPNDSKEYMQCLQMATSLVNNMTKPRNLFPLLVNTIINLGDEDLAAECFFKNFREDGYYYKQLYAFCEKFGWEHYSQKVMETGTVDFILPWG